ncbi:MAG: sensor histidine kinase, partial [Blastocatellia bacterium]
SATDVFDAQGIRWEFTTPADPKGIKLGAEQRRHIYLIFREAINNVARHSKCTSATLAIETDGRILVVKISDDGCGFARDSAADGRAQDAERADGHGLENMKARAAELGGTCQIDSASGAGTRIRVEVPLRRGTHEATA